MTPLIWFAFVLAAIMEVCGDAVIRKGMRGGAPWLTVAGFVVLGAYGITVNTVRWDFSKMLGVYICFFAAISILAGRFVFKETVPISTWLGLALIIAGGAIIQVGRR